MSALYYGHVEVGPNGDGQPVYAITFEERTLPGWTRPASAQVPVFIPAQRRSDDPFARELLGGIRASGEA